MIWNIPDDTSGNTHDETTVTQYFDYSESVNRDGWHEQRGNQHQHHYSSHLPSERGKCTTFGELRTTQCRSATHQRKSAGRRPRHCDWLEAGDHRVVSTQRKSPFTAEVNELFFVLAAFIASDIHEGYQYLIRY